MNDKDHLIWTDYDFYNDSDLEDLRSENPNLSEDELIELIYEENIEALGDERLNLDIQYNQPILVVGDLGLWNGRRSGYKEIVSGNIKDCLYSDTDFTTWYVDSLGDLRCNATHHDGTNRYLYRVYKSSATETQKDNLKDKIYHGTATRQDITRITKRLGDEIGKVYGWNFPVRVHERGKER